MDIVTGVLEFLATNIFGEVAILIGLITLVGLLLQRKPVEETVAGTLRATIGVIVLFIGVDIFSEGLTAFQTIVGSAVGLDPPQSTNTLGDFLGSHGGSFALIIAVGFLLHVLAVGCSRPATSTSPDTSSSGSPSSSPPHWWRSSATSDSGRWCSPALRSRRPTGRSSRCSSPR